MILVKPGTYFLYCDKLYLAENESNNRGQLVIEVATKTRYALDKVQASIIEEISEIEAMAHMI